MPFTKPTSSSWRRARGIRGKQAQEGRCPDALNSGRSSGKAARRLLLFLPWLIAATPAVSAPDDSLLGALRDSDLQLSTLGDRLARANVALCDQRQPDTGLVIHALDDYAPDMRDAARRVFGFASPVAVEAVIPGSPAAAADIQPNDAIVSVNDVAIDATPLAASASLSRLSRFLQEMAALPPDQPLRLTLIRGGQRLVRTLQPVPECRGRFELVIANSFASSTSDDGTTARIGSRFLADLPEDAVVVVVAHEFAHLILRHEQRLTAAGVSGGLAGGFGRNVRYIRQAETQADILSVDLLANAGWNPDLAPRFWRSWGRKLSGGIFADRSHPAAIDRAATTEREAEAIAADPAHARHPPVLVSRDRPLDGDWQSILVRAHQARSSP